MRRAQSLSVAKRNQMLLVQINEIKTDHPLWGYRRTWSYLKYRQGISVNKKRVYRIMKEQNLTVTKLVRLKARRGPIRPKPHAEHPNHFWGIDMTKIKLASWGWLYLTVVLTGTPRRSSAILYPYAPKLMIGSTPCKWRSTTASPTASDLI